jgi:anti-sigma factor RsiW
MKRQGTGNRDQGSVERLLREALPPIAEAEPPDDLWPAMQRRLRAEGAGAPVKVRVPWFDWALAAGLVALLALFPAWIPVLLYYL